MFEVEIPAVLQPCSFDWSICLLLTLSVFTFLSDEDVLGKNIERIFSVPSRTFATVLRTTSSSITSGRFCIQLGPLGL